MRGGFRAFILGLFCRPLFRAVFLGAFSRNADRPLWIVDIDNTLAHTWPSLNEKHGSEKDHKLFLPNNENREKTFFEELYISSRHYLLL